jgi:hypothetical protein
MKRRDRTCGGAGIGSSQEDRGVITFAPFVVDRQTVGDGSGCRNVVTTLAALFSGVKLVVTDQMASFGARLKT